VQPARAAAEVEDRCGVAYEVASAETPSFRQQGVLVRTGNATLLEATPRQGCSDTDRGITYPSDTEPSRACDGEDEHYLFHRPPLEATIRVGDADGVPELTVLVNHWKSKITSSGCEQANCSDWRVEQARHLPDLVADRSETPKPLRPEEIGDPDGMLTERLQFLRDRGGVRRPYGLGNDDLELVAVGIMGVERLAHAVVGLAAGTACATGEPFVRLAEPTLTGG
jgi:hypothetical protein